MSTEEDLIYGRLLTIEHPLAVMGSVHSAVHLVRVYEGRQNKKFKGGREND